MIADIIKTWQENKDSLPRGDMFKCDYCHKEFKKESTLISHMCEPKRRWNQKNEPGVIIGLQAYQRFYELTQLNSKSVDYQSFVNSSFYTAFVKFGRYIVDIRAVDSKRFIDYVIKENIKIDNWCSDRVYMEFLHYYLRTESVQSALERSLLEMQRYTDESLELKNGFKDYFRYGNKNRICFDISNGRVSPWVIFNCSSGINFLEGISEEQLSTIIDIINPDYWQRKFIDFTNDCIWIKHILTVSGI